LERADVSDENLDWIFVNMVPLLCNKIRIAKQQKIETWLRLYQAAAELGLQKPDNHGTPRSDYVV
jgi:hypothetical protein